MSVIEIHQLVVRRGSKTVLNGLNLSVAEGEVYALLGGNGAGKSTTLLSLLGFLTPDSGDCKILGQSVSNAPAEARQHMAYLPESANLYTHMNAYENLRYFLGLSGIKTTWEDMDMAFNRVALPEEAREKRLQDYSKGMRQKTAIALAILRKANVLLLDEPTSGLDPVAINDFNRLVTELASTGCAILMVTHDLYGACQSANHIGLLRDGHLVKTFNAAPGERIQLGDLLASFNPLEAA